MHRLNHRAAACIEAVRLARDPARLQQAPAAVLVLAAVTLSKALVHTVDAGWLRAQRAAAMDMIDNAGKPIGQEFRRRQQNLL
jgi:hypothetical protein